MNVDQPEPLEEQFSSVLAAWDEDLAAGAAPGLVVRGEDPPELRARLERGLACLHRLQRLRPRRGAAEISCAPPAVRPGGTDRNLLFGVLALQADLIDQAQFVDVCTLWANRKHVPLADLLVERGWLKPTDKADVDRLLARKLQKHAGDVQASLAEVAHGAVQQALSGLEDADVRQSLADLAPPAAVSGGTVDYVPEPGQRYTLTRLHATGGIGRVWLAHDSDLGREVALKELRPERAENPRFWARFLHEAQITGQLEHPGIVPVYELTRRPDDHQPFYTMRFIKGRTLSDAIRTYHEKRGAGRAEPLEQIALLNAFVAVCNAVAYAHSRGVIHRDLKGQNVVVGDFGEVIVLDWGFAKVLGRAEGSIEAAPVALAQEEDSHHTVQGQVLGTPAYMAPEQAEGRLDLIDRRTDVYGLGAILYELLTGQPPFTGSEIQEVLRKVREEEPARPRQVHPGVPRALEAVCLRALAKKPAERYASAGELAREVQRWLADEPVTAYREPVAARLGRWARRHQPLVTGLAALLLAAVVGAVVLREEWVLSEERVQAAEKQTAIETLAKNRVETTTYLKQIALADREVLAKQLARADELLEACEPGLRAWEWHYLQRRTHRCLLTLRGHTAPIWPVVYSPDGLQLASADDAGSVKLWDAMTGRLIRTLPRHTGGVRSLAYRPPYGQHLASTGFQDSSVRVWDTNTGSQVHELRHEHQLVFGVDYSPDGRQLASSSWDQTVRIWDATTGQLIRILFRHTDRIQHLAYSPSGRQIAFVSLGDRTLRLWDVATQKEIHKFLGRTSILAGAAFSPGGTLLASAGLDDATVWVWDTTTGEEIRTLRGENGGLRAPVFSPDGRLLVAPAASGARLDAIRVWEATTGREIRTLHGHRTWLTTVAFSPDGRRLASTGGDGTIKVWDVTDLERSTGLEALLLGRHSAAVRSVAFNPAGGLLAAAGQDGTVRIWNTTPGQHPDPLLAAFSPPSVVQALAAVWVTLTGPELLTLAGHQGSVASVGFSPDGQRLASAGEDGTIQVRNATTGQVTLTLRVPVAPVRCVVFSTDGRLATVSGEKTMAIWDATTGQELRTFHTSEGILHSVAFSPDGKWLASVDVMGTLQLWDTTTGQGIGTMHAQPSNPSEIVLGQASRGQEFIPRQQARSVGCVAFSSNGQRLAWTGEDRTVTIWDWSALPSSLSGEGEVKTVTLRGHAGLLTSLVFSPDGKRLVTAAEDKTVRLWETTTGQEALTLRGHTDVIHSVAFSPDGRLIAAAGAAGTVYLWDGTSLSDDPGRGAAAPP